MAPMNYSNLLQQIQDTVSRVGLLFPC